MSPLTWNNPPYLFFFNVSHNINQAICLLKYLTFWISLVVFSQTQIKHFGQECHIDEVCVSYCT